MLESCSNVRSPPQTKFKCSLETSILFAYSDKRIFMLIMVLGCFFKYWTVLVTNWKKKFHLKMHREKTLPVILFKEYKLSSYYDSGFKFCWRLCILYIDQRCRYRVFASRPLFTYLPFSLGHRSCVGQQFATVSLLLCLTFGLFWDWTVTSILHYIYYYKSKNIESAC